jgi:hypothetical protein
MLTTCQPSTVWCSRERLPAAAAQPAQGSLEPVAPRIHRLSLVKKITRRFGDWSLSPSSGKKDTYSVGPNRYVTMFTETVNSHVPGGTQMFITALTKTSSIDPILASLSYSRLWNILI